MYVILLYLYVFVFVFIYFDVKIIFCARDIRNSNGFSLFKNV